MKALILKKFANRIYNFLAHQILIQEFDQMVVRLLAEAVREVLKDEYEQEVLQVGSMGSTARGTQGEFPFDFDLTLLLSVHRLERIL